MAQANLHTLKNLWSAVILQAIADYKYASCDRTRQSAIEFFDSDIFKSVLDVMGIPEDRFSDLYLIGRRDVDFAMLLL